MDRLNIRQLPRIGKFTSVDTMLEYYTQRDRYFSWTKLKHRHRNVITSVSFVDFIFKISPTISSGLIMMLESTEFVRNLIGGKELPLSWIVHCSAK